MSQLLVAQAHRRCALLLAPLHRRDQMALLEDLPPGDAEMVKQLLQELSASSLPIEALPSGWLDEDRPSEAGVSERAHRIDWNALAGSVSAPWLARALACVQGAEREFCMATLDTSSRIGVAPLISSVPTLPPALEKCLRKQLLTVAEQG